MSWANKDRGTKEYDTPCKDCRVIDWIVCPMAEKAFEDGKKLKRCEVLKDFGEALITAMGERYSNRRGA